MRTIINTFFICVAMCLVSCEDILEDDISGDNVTMIYPTSGTVIESNVVTFQWQELDGADDYRLQVYAQNQVVLDTLVGTAHFAGALNPGDYQWRVRGENSAYETNYSFPASFSVVATEDLTNQLVLLGSPSANIYTQNTAQTFTWSTIASATTYNFSLLNVTGGNTVVVEVPELTTGSYAIPQEVITQDGQYLWRVKALNEDNGTETQYATRNFYIDTTIPNQSQNSLPLNNAILSTDDEINFEWTIPQDSGIITSTIQYTIQIATDTSFSNIVQTGTTISNTYSYTFTAQGNYYWRVRAVDAAGNQGTYSSYFKITVQ